MVASGPRGLVGLGEATPLPGYSLDSLDDARHALEGLDREVARGLGHETLDDLDPIELTAVAVGEAVRSIPSLLSTPSARFAVETSLADLASRANGEPVSSWLSGGRVLSRVERSVLVGAVDDADMPARARAAIGRGARTLKLKANGVDPAREVEAILELRRALEPVAIAVRLDLNGALGPEEAGDALAHYARADVELVEEPTSASGLLELGKRAVPWFADESLQDELLRKRLLDDVACAGFVIKPTLLGLFGARRVALDALRAGKHVVVTHTREGPVALAAACELALSLPRPPLACGLDLHASLASFPAAEVRQLSESAGKPFDVHPSGWEGLGLEVAFE